MSSGLCKWDFCTKRQIVQEIEKASNVLLLFKVMSLFSGNALIYRDVRLGGSSRYVITDKPERLMRIPNEIRKCVAFLGYRNQDGIYCLAGTAFFISRSIEGTEHAFHYLITARHIINEIRDHRSNKICLRMNLASGSAVWIETPIEDWIYHPDEDEADVAVLRFNVPPELDHMTLPISMFITDQVLADDVGIGSEIFLAGLFASHHGQHRNIPIVRIGNIIAMPEEKVLTGLGYIDAYLVEARSLGGISGSPVFAAVPAFKTSQLETRLKFRHSHIFHLIGLMHGHWNLYSDMGVDAATVEDIQGKTSVNMGIAIVVPSSKILEVINQPVIRKPERATEAQLRKSLLPAPDDAPAQERKGHGTEF